MMTPEPIPHDGAKPRLSSAARPVSKQAWLPLFTANDQGKVSGPPCSGSATSFARNGLSWSSRRATRPGKPKSLTIFAELATTAPALNLRLAMLARLIREGGCSFLPAPACRDWRSPGLRSHPRLKQSRGQQMPEVLGTRVSSHLYLWMLNLPAKWFESAAGNGEKL
jgi:hypothetical protein